MTTTDHGSDKASTTPQRRVSINDGHDNPAFEPNPRRKVSQQSDHSDIGPVRKKSILANAGEVSAIDHENRFNGLKKGSLTSDTGHSHHGHSQHPKIDNDKLEQSWIFALCMRCRSENNSPSWEPPHWQKVCPYPLCPSYRQFARFISIILIGLLIWVTAFVIIGDSAAPGGQLFGLVVLTVAANFGGWIISLTTLPRLIGMLIVGILFQNVGWVDLDGDFTHVTAELRKFALVIILIRAGLEMDPEAFKRIYVTILKLGLIPWTVECGVCAVMSHYLLDLPWIWAFLLGSIIAAVSPAVVVPCLFRLRTKGYGVVKGIPTLIIAVAGIDDAASVAVFGIISSILFTTDGGLGMQIAQAPVCILGGLGFGVFWGCLSRIVPEPGDAFVVPIRVLMLFGGGLLAVYGSEEIGFEGAGPLGVVFAAFTSSYFWCKQGWELEDNPAATAFEIFWMIFEPILFGITGATVKINELDPDIVSWGVLILISGVVIRILCTVAIAFGDKLNLKEKIFVSLSWMAKATVQAALGPVALKHITNPDDAKYGEIVLMLCVLSIILTAPTGAILITLTGTKLLTKTKAPPVTEGWRRSHRPSLFDISIINEEEEKGEDAENGQSSGPKPTHLTPTFTITN